MAEDLWRLLSRSVASDGRRRLTPALLQRYHAAVTAVHPDLFTIQELTEAFNVSPFGPSFPSEEAELAILGFP